MMPKRPAPTRPIGGNTTARAITGRSERIVGTARPPFVSAHPGDTTIEPIEGGRTSRTRTLLAAVGLAGALFACLGATAASAQAQDGPAGQSPRASGRSSEAVRLVEDPGVAAGQATDSATNLASCYDGQKPWDARLRDPDGDSHYIPGRDDAPDSSVGRVRV
jgi:hypothetical protein